MVIAVIVGILKHLRGNNLGKDLEPADLAAWMHRPHNFKVIPTWDHKVVLTAFQKPPFDLIQDP